MIKNYKQYIKENILNNLKGYTEDEMEKNLSDKSTDDKLFIYAKQDYLKGVKEILDSYDANDDNKIKWADLILSDAVAYGSMEVLKYLIEERNADINGHYGYNLENAASNDQPEVIKYLLSMGANPDVNGGGPIWRAISYGFIECTKILLEAGAKIEGYMIEKAHQNENEEMVQLLNKYKETNYVEKI